jgi:hypothetical protein
MGQTYKIGTTATMVRNRDGKTEVKYHNTVVVAFDESEIILNCGGWWTATTKNRMNQASNQFDLGYNVFQKDFLWYVESQGKVVEFNENRIVLNRK